MSDNIVNDNKFGPPIRTSQIDGDVSVIVAQWGPPFKDSTHDYFVRGTRVSKTNIKEESNGRLYRWCLFPDGAVQLVNEGNIYGKRVTKGYANGR